jgi:O-acetyl-ADP-ribose deacetylase (regulator of RNase III)
VLLDFLQILEGSLPVRYLGIPLISTRLLAVDCESLVSRITARIDSWIAKHLYFAGRLQLITSILFSDSFSSPVRIGGSILNTMRRSSRRNE